MNQALKLILALTCLALAGFIFWRTTMAPGNGAVATRPPRAANDRGQPLHPRAAHNAAARAEAATPLHPQEADRRLCEAADRGDVEEVRAMLEAGARITADLEGWPALVLAASQGHVEIIRTLLEAGFEPDYHRRGDWTALLIASANDHPEAMRVLLDAGADPLQQNSMGKSAFELVVERNAQRAAAVLAEPEVARRDGRALIAAASTGNIREVRRLLEAGADANGVNHLGRTALLDALASHIPDEMRRSDDNDNLDLIKLLLEHGADPNHPDENGRTAVINALFIGYHGLDPVATLDLLLRHGGRLDVKDKRGDTLFTLVENLKDPPRDALRQLLYRYKKERRASAPAVAE